MAASIALGDRGRGRTAPNPNVGCLIVKDGVVVGRGWTQSGGRPHAEAMALAQAGDAARGATAYVTLEPCAHESERGPRCSESLIGAGIARVVAAIEDPDPRTAGKGFERLRAAGVAVETGVLAPEAERSMAGCLTRQRHRRPHVTLKLATSIDGCIALADGRSRWITGEAARAHAHLERSRSEAIVVGRGTFEADAPALDVRLSGLEDRSPRRFILSSQTPFVPSEVEGRGSGTAPLDFARDERDWEWLSGVEAIATLDKVDHILVEGGASAAAAFLARDMVDRLLLYRAPILIGCGRASIGDIGLADLAGAHGRWRLCDTRALGSDTLEVYERTQCSPE